MREAARVLSRYVDLIAIRCFPKFQNWAEEKKDPLISAFAAHATVPVINMETIVHPCQELAMMMALQDRHGDVAGKDFLLTWVPHPKPLNTAVANSAILMASKMGMNVRMLIPDDVYRLDDRYMDAAERFCGENNASFTVTTDVEEAYSGAHAVYAKSWGGRSVDAGGVRRAEAGEIDAVDAVLEQQPGGGDLGAGEGEGLAIGLHLVVGGDGERGGRDRVAAGQIDHAVALAQRACEGRGREGEGAGPDVVRREDEVGEERRAVERAARRREDVDRGATGDAAGGACGRGLAILQGDRVGACEDHLVDAVDRRVKVGVAGGPDGVEIPARRTSQREEAGGVPEGRRGKAGAAVACALAGGLGVPVGSGDRRRDDIGIEGEVLSDQTAGQDRPDGGRGDGPRGVNARQAAPEGAPDEAADDAGAGRVVEGDAHRPLRVAVRDQPGFVAAGVPACKELLDGVVLLDRDGSRRTGLGQASCIDAGKAAAEPPNGESEIGHVGGEVLGQQHAYIAVGAGIADAALVAPRKPAHGDVAHEGIAVTALNVYGILGSRRGDGAWKALVGQVVADEAAGVQLGIAGGDRDQAAGGFELFGVEVADKGGHVAGRFRAGDRAGVGRREAADLGADLVGDGGHRERVVGRGAAVRDRADVDPGKAADKPDGVGAGRDRAARAGAGDGAAVRSHQPAGKDPQSGACAIDHAGERRVGDGAGIDRREAADIAPGGALSEILGEAGHVSGHVDIRDGACIAGDEPAGVVAGDVDIGQCQIRDRRGCFRGEEQAGVGEPVDGEPVDGEAVALERGREADLGIADRVEPQRALAEGAPAAGRCGVDVVAEGEMAVEQVEGIHALQTVGIGQDVGRGDGAAAPRDTQEAGAGAKLEIGDGEG
ncbi:hypothetical protein [Salipiger bermudensis]|uniref:hypothetical protein n=1 Tax=Salipiger bermudensis TaxID=344736 RepID=UPI0035139876